MLHNLIVFTDEVSGAYPLWLLLELAQNRGRGRRRPALELLARGAGATLDALRPGRFLSERHEHQRAAPPAA